MKKEQVPQDYSRSYGGHQKLLYAVDHNGKYSGVQSSGWEAEEQATHSAIAELKRLSDEAWQRASNGFISPLPYHMYKRRMDIALLAQTTGLFKWRIKRHFKPAIFNRLSDNVLNRYCSALGLDPATLKTLPDLP